MNLAPMGDFSNLVSLQSNKNFVIVRKKVFKNHRSDSIESGKNYCTLIGCTRCRDEISDIYDVLANISFVKTQKPFSSSESFGPETLLLYK